MIDTINYRVHKLEKYETFVNALKSFTQGSTKYKAFTEWSDESGRKRQISDGQKSVTLYHDTNTVLPWRYSSKLVAPSYSYSVSYMVDYDKDFINFEFSIPKYIAGHNLFQFVSYSTPMDSDIMYRMLVDFTSEFFAKYSPIKIEKIDIEICRIDLCFNQFHVSEDSCRQTLTYLKKKFGVTLRNRKQKVEHEDSFYIRNEHYMFKVYHKGTEFMKHDYRELEKHGSKKDLGKLCSVANRILRYEISYRRPFMNYVFHKIYRHGKYNCKYTIFRKLWKGLNIEKKESDNYLQKRFYLKSVFDKLEEVKERYPKSEDRVKFYALHKDRVTFNDEIFYYLYKHFWSTVKKAECVVSLNEQQAYKMLDELNAKIVRNNLFVDDKKKRFKVNAKHFYHYIKLSQTAPINSFCPEQFSYRTLTNIRKVFREIGLEDYNPDLSLLKTNFDYQDYKSQFGNLHRGKYI